MNYVSLCSAQRNDACLDLLWRNEIGGYCVGARLGQEGFGNYLDSVGRKDLRRCGVGKLDGRRQANIFAWLVV